MIKDICSNCGSDRTLFSIINDEYIYCVDCKMFCFVKQIDEDIVIREYYNTFRDY